METRRLNILFLTDNFPPERNVPAMRTWEHVSRWVKDGHQVTVITTAPNFPQGKPLAGYKNHWYFKEDMGGVKVIRVKSYIAANEGFLKRILDYVSFMVTGGIAAMFQRRPEAGSCRGCAACPGSSSCVTCGRPPSWPWVP